MAEGIWKGLTQDELREVVLDIKDKIHGESSLDWEDICFKHNLDIHSDSLRKASSGVALMEAAGMDQDRLTHKVESGAAKAIRASANEAFRTMSRSEAMRDLIKDVASKIRPYELDSPTPIRYSEDRSLVLVVADPHYGAEWEVHGLNGEVINAYSPEIFEQRMIDLLDQAITIIEREEISHVHVMLAGDALDGMLRPSQLMHLKYGVIESTMRFAEFFAAWLWKLSSYAVIDAWFVPGNHGEIRPLGSKKGDFADENAERIIPWWIKERLSSSKRRVEIHCTDSKMQLIDIHGYNFVLDHGDEKNKIEDVCKQSMLLYGTPIHFYVCGHLHRRNDIPTGCTPDGNTYILRVPSIAGMDKYAQSLQYGGKAGASAYVIERKYGLRCSYPIVLK